MIREEETGEEGEKKKADFPFLISHFSLPEINYCWNQRQVALQQHRLERGLVPPRDGTQVPYLNGADKLLDQCLLHFQVESANEK